MGYALVYNVLNANLILKYMDILILSYICSRDIELHHCLGKQASTSLNFIETCVSNKPFFKLSHTRYLPRFRVC